MTFGEGANDADAWLAGSRQQSKKIFSFKDPPRTFGFVKPGLLTLDQMRERLNGAWQDLNNEEFLTGSNILDRLLDEAKGGAR
jgi:CRISPR-associated protein Cmr1